MFQRSSVFAACAALFLVCALRAVEEPAPAPAAAPKPAQVVPPFALGVVTFRELGTALDKTGLYANQLLPNSSTLARQIAMSYLFTLPVDAGLKADGLARVYALDPVSSGVNNERALVLTVADAAAVKTGLIGAYGAPAEADGVMTFTLPQPIPQPDRTLLVKIVGDKLFTAPNAPVLAKLEEFEKTSAAPAAGDAVVTLRVGALKRAYGELAELTIDALIDLAADEQAANLREVAKLIDTLWQFEAVDLVLHLHPKGDSGQLELTAFPKAGTAVATKMAQPGKVLSERALRLIPEKSALFLAWVVSGPEVAKLLQPRLGTAAKNAAPALQPHIAAFEKALVDLVSASDGEVVVSLSGTDIRSPFLLASADVPDEAQALAKVTTALESLNTLANAQMKQGAPEKAGDILVLKMGDSEIAGVKVKTFEYTQTLLTEDERLDVSELVGWPPVVRVCTVDKKLILALGRESNDDLSAAIARLKNGPTPTAPDAAPDHAQRALKDAVARGSQAAASLTALNAAKLILSRTPLPPETTLDRLLRGLADQPVVLSGKALNQFSLRLDLPSGAAHAIGSIFQRVDRVMRAAAAGDAAPPPPPAP